MNLGMQEGREDDSDILLKSRIMANKLLVFVFGYEVRRGASIND